MKPVFDENGLATEPGDIRCFYYDAVTSEYTGWSDEYINIGVSMPGDSTNKDPGDEVSGKSLYSLMGHGRRKKIIVVTPCTRPTPEKKAQLTILAPLKMVTPALRPPDRTINGMERSG